ncbi:MAG: Mth938-like domain-containing protein [Polymorphobacter sp.]
MQFEPQHSDALLVEGYAGRGFIVGGTAWPAGVLVRADGVSGIDNLDLAAFAPLDAADPAIELVLIGTGATMQRPDTALLAALAAKGWATEFMDSRAAARTYNVLVHEGRHVAAALLPV